MAAAAAGGGAGAEALGGESRKLFVGGIPASAQEAELQGHFCRYGAVRSIVVMRDKETGHGRGFGFVEFEDEDAADRALGDGERPRHHICGRLVDVKRARARPPRNHGDQPVQHQQPEQGLDLGHKDSHPAGHGTENGSNRMSSSRKVFVGGLRDNINEDEFRAYFEKFGTVTDVVVIYDSQTNRSRGFGFVTFDSDEAVRKVMEQSFHDLKGTRVEAKIAIPKDSHFYRSTRGGRGFRTFGGRGSFVYDGSSYEPYNDRYGYMPQPVPTNSYPGLYYGGMGGYPFANLYANQGVMTSMVARRPMYTPYPPFYPGYGVVYRSGYAGAATSVQHGVNGGSDNKKDQASVDVQDVDNAAAVATKLEQMMLGSQ